MAFTDARIITVEDGEVIEDGTVIVRNGRLDCVGACSTDGIDRVFDASGKTIIPGLIDMHAHHHRDHEGVLPKKNWESAVYLAYGVTTTLDNSQWSSNVFPAAELVESGAVIGPRMYSTGDQSTLATAHARTKSQATSWLTRTWHDLCPGAQCRSKSTCNHDAHSDSGLQMLHGNVGSW